MNILLRDPFSGQQSLQGFAGITDITPEKLKMTRTRHDLRIAGTWL